MEPTFGFEAATFRTPDCVLLAYGSIAPVARDMAYTISRGDSRMKFKFKLGENRQPVPPEGRVVFLHGWGLDASSMLPWALALSGLGYRCLMVDLRNHGRSSPPPAGLGARVPLRKHRG